MRRTCARPIPRPSNWGSLWRRWKRLNSLLLYSGSKPMPLSWIRRMTSCWLAVVLDVDHGAFARAGELQRVAEELGEDLADHPRVALDAGKRIQPQVNGTSFHFEFEFLQDGFDGVIEADGGQVDVSTAEARVGEHAIEQASHLVRGLGDDAEVLSRCRIEFVGEML